MRQTSSLMKRQGRIALVLLRLGGGGVPRVRVALAAAFLKQGFAVDIVAFRAEGPRCEHVPAGADVIDLSARSVRSAIRPLRRYLQEKRPDALISATEGPNLASVIACISTRRRPRLAVGTHNTLSTILKERMSARTRIWLPWALRFAYRQADVVLTVSQGVAADLGQTVGLPAKHIRVIYNPLVNTQADDLGNLPVLHPWIAAKEEQVILGVGRITSQKDFKTLLLAFADLRRKLPARLLFLGEGPERENLESLARELRLAGSVAFLGFVADPYAYMRRADLVVLSSRYEGFGNVIVEALACGCPVVSTDCPHGPREILRNGEYGRLVPVGDYEQLARAMAASLASPPAPEFLRQRAMDFHIDRIIEQYCEALGI